MKDYYKILRLKRFSSQDEVKTAFRELAKIYHPDKNNGQIFYQEFFTEIKDAYEFLMDNSNKTKYDNFLKENPDLIQKTEIITKIQAKDNDLVNGEKKYKARTILKILTGFVIFIIMFAYLQNSQKEKKKLIFERDSIARLNYIEKQLDSIRKDEIKQDEIRQEINRQELKNTNIQESSGSNNAAQNSTKPKKHLDKDWCKNIRILYTESSPFVVIVNENNFEIDKVTCTVFYKPGYDGFYYPSDKVSFLNIKPGQNHETVTTNVGPFELIIVSSCEDYGR